MTVLNGKQGRRPTGQWWVPPIDSAGTERLAAMSVRDRCYMQPFPPESLIQYWRLLDNRLHGLARNALKLRPKRVEQAIRDRLCPTLAAFSGVYDPDSEALALVDSLVVQDEMIPMLVDGFRIRAVLEGEQEPYDLDPEEKEHVIHLAQEQTFEDLLVLAGLGAD